MSLIQSTAIPSGVADDYQIGHSVRFNNPTNPYLSRSFVTPTNRKIWTFSIWLKRSFNPDYPRIFSTATGAGGNTDNINFMNDDKLRFISDFGQLTTTQVFRDPSAWYHIMYAFDSTQSTEANRLKLYVNGTQVTSFATANYPTLNDEVDFNSAVVHDIGRNAPESAQSFDGYLAETYFIDGAAKAPSDFGQIGTYGEWKPIEYSGGSYGNNGWYLNFATAADMGDDKSGEGHDFTEHNIAATDQMLDTPTSNFCTWNPVSTQEAMIATLTQGNLRYNPAGATMDEPYGMKGTLAVDSGKWYFEVGRRDTGNDYHTCISGVVNGVRKFFTLYSGNYYFSPEGNGTIGQASPGTDGQISGCAFDLENNKIWFAVNGTWTNSGNPSNNTGGFPLTAGLKEVSIFTEHPNGSYDGDDIMNCGQDSSFQGLKTSQGNQDANEVGDFYYAPPTNFLALNTQNLPTPAVVPSENFKTIIYDDGAGAKVTGFQPDLVWFKGRSAGYDHQLVDAVRGATKKLQSNDNTLEGTASNGLTSFNTNGFTVGSDASYSSQVGEGLVAWNWKANGSGSNNTDGDITSVVSANVDSGFSIVTYTGNGNNIDVGHGLSKPPEIVIVKERSGGGGWYANVKNIPSQSAGTDMVAVLNTTAALNGMNVGQWYFGSQAPTSSVFRVQNKEDVGANGDTHVAYCFHSVEGYSAISSYLGNGQNVPNGRFTYTGFRPAYVMLKRADSADPWVIFDSAREPENEDDGQDLSLKANATDAEAAYGNIDFLSNGFKVQITSGFMNADGSPYVYMAFAETPFKFSNAR